MTHTKRILLVDDENDVRELFEEMIYDQVSGVEVDTADNGKVALQKLRTHHYDVVVTDIKMPQKSGFELMDELRSVSTTIPIIVVSAYLDDDTIQRAWQLGAFDYVKKVDAFKCLTETVRIALNVSDDFDVKPHEIANSEVIPIRLHMNKKIWRKAFELAKEEGKSIEDYLLQVIDQKVV